MSFISSSVRLTIGAIKNAIVCRRGFSRRRHDRSNYPGCFMCPGTSCPHVVHLQAPFVWIPDRDERRILRCILSHDVRRRVGVDLACTPLSRSGNDLTCTPLSRSGSKSADEVSSPPPALNALRARPLCVEVCAEVVRQHGRGGLGLGVLSAVLLHRCRPVVLVVHFFQHGGGGGLRRDLVSVQRSDARKQSWLATHSWCTRCCSGSATLRAVTRRSEAELVCVCGLASVVQFLAPSQAWAPGIQVFPGQATR